MLPSPPISNVKKSVALLHAGAWLLYGLYVYVIRFLRKSPRSIDHTILHFFILITGFYIVVFCLYQFKKKNGIWRGSASLLLSFILLVSIAYLYQYILLLRIGRQFYNAAHLPFNTFILMISGYYSRSFIFALLYFIIQNYYKKEQEKLRFEYAFLKSQINPHFLYNTLNTIYAQAQALNHDLAENIQKLSAIMRYSLEHASRMNGIVYIQQELKHLELLIDIQQWRFSGTLHVKYELTGTASTQTIPALALLTVVENAFKYGNLKNAHYPLTIRMDFQASSLYFYCSNKKKRILIFQQSTHVGLTNLKRRLDIAYKKNYHLAITDLLEEYTLELTIKY